MTTQKDLTVIFPGDQKELAKFNPAGYWELPKDVYVTDNDSIVIAIIDSAIDETLVLYWSVEDNTWYHYTNCFGLGEGDDGSTTALLADWYQDAVS